MTGWPQPTASQIATITPFGMSTSVSQSSIRCVPLARQPIACEWALWFHDAVYDPKASDNEEKSAALAQQCLRDQAIGGPLADEVTRLILATKHTEATTDPDAALVVDIDLSILGRDEARFCEYEEQIRREYAWVPWDVYAARRAELLQRFLERERLFRTDWFFERYEAQARRNLAASIARVSNASSMTS